jgi:hypothetical protein
MPRKSKKKAGLFVASWTVIRILAVFLLWWNVILGFIINILLDAVDGDIIERFKVNQAWYERWDKLLDLWFYAVLAFFIYSTQPRTEIWYWMLLFFAYRMIGTILFTAFKKEWLLLIFPNIFTGLFLINFLFPTISSWNFIFPSPYPLLIILIVFGLIKESWIHVLKIDLTDLLTHKKQTWK